MWGECTQFYKHHSRWDLSNKVDDNQVKDDMRKDEIGKSTLGADAAELLLVSWINLKSEASS